MIVNRGWAVSLALAERHELGRFVILHGVQRYRADRRERSHGGAVAATGWGLEVQSLHGATAGASAPGSCCACKRGRACPDPGKHPRVIKGVQEHGHLDARSADELAELIADLRPRPINLGIVPSTQILVIDIDPRNGGDETLVSLQDQYGPLPPTLSVYTGGGGEHRWYRAPYAASRSAVLGPGVDLKTSGGLLVAPPSVHLTGRRYAWTNRHLPPTDAPTWLDENTRKAETVSGGAGRRSTERAPDGVIGREMAKAVTGERQNTLYRLACWAWESGGEQIDDLRWAARGTGLTESEIRTRIEAARRKVGI